MKTFLSHPDSYDSNDAFHINDIALLRVSRIGGDINDGNFVPEPICLPDGEEIDDGTTCYAIGWGKTSTNGGLSTQASFQNSNPAIILASKSSSLVGCPIGKLKTF